MIAIEYSSRFVRRYKKLERARKEEARARIEEFRNPINHARLAVHALKGNLQGMHAFSVNYADRIVFEWSADHKTAYLFSIGNHAIYEQ